MKYIYQINDVLWQSYLHKSGKGHHFLCSRFWDLELCKAQLSRSAAQCLLPWALPWAAMSCGWPWLQVLKWPSTLAGSCWWPSAGSSAGTASRWGGMTCPPLAAWASSQHGSCLVKKEYPQYKKMKDTNFFLLIPFSIHPKTEKTRWYVLPVDDYLSILTKLEVYHYTSGKVGLRHESLCFSLPLCLQNDSQRKDQQT